jgi:hypothetical protein
MSAPLIVLAIVAVAVFAGMAVVVLAPTERTRHDEILENAARRLQGIA